MISQRKINTRSLAIAPRLAQPSLLFGPWWMGIRSAPFRLLTLLVAWQGRARDRIHLRELDDRLLRDVGLTRADVAREAAVPFWRDRLHPSR